MINVTEVREIHRRALEPVWAVAPHPEATDREAPGGFREHDIHPFSGGMPPPPWPDIMPQIITWVEEYRSLVMPSVPDLFRRGTCLSAWR